MLYPIGISSECTLIFKALGPAAEITPLFRWALLAILAIYVPGMCLFMVGLGVLLTGFRFLCSLHTYDCAAPKGSSGEEAR